MSIIKEAMEECVGCNKSTGNLNYKEVITPFNKVKGMDGFTYDEGKGIKDSVILSGPLSEVYTKALNISLKKVPLEASEETPEDLTRAIDTSVADKDENVSDSGVVANENLIEEELLNSLATLNIAVKEQKKLNDNFEFTTLATDPNNIVANINVLTPAEASKASNVDEIQKYKENNENQDTILVVTVPTMAGSEGTKINQKLVNLGEEHPLVFGDPHEETKYKEAFETLYESNGIKVFYGLEGFKQALDYLVRDL
jgi:hypothetical protein